MYEVFSKILHARLVQWLNAYDILPESQDCFRSGHSTRTAISTLLKGVQISLDASISFYIFSVDFGKAFDSVSRRMLITNPHTLGNSFLFVNVLYQCLVINMVFIGKNQYLTNQRLQIVGVPPGDRLAPLQFTVFIGDLDLLSRKTGTPVVFYADD